MTRATRLLAAWIATLAILFAAVAPSIAHAVASAGGGAVWAEICTSKGIRLVQLDADADPAGTSQPTHVKHCVFCNTGADSAAPPPAFDLLLPVLAGAGRMPPLFYQSPHPLFLWAPAQSRAPPQLA